MYKSQILPPTKIDTLESPAAHFIYTDQGYKSYTNYLNPSKKTKGKLPEGVIFALLPDNVDRCPCCDSKLINVDINKRRCMSCHHYLALPDDSPSTIVDQRILKGVYSADIDVKHMYPGLKHYIYSKFSKMTHLGAIGYTVEIDLKNNNYTNLLNYAHKEGLKSGVPIYF